MLELVLKLIEKLSQWVVLKNDQKEARNALLDGIFADLERVQMDYVRIFTELDSDLADVDSFDAILRKFSARRKLMEPIRDRLREQVNPYGLTPLLPLERHLFFQIRAYLGLLPAEVEIDTISADDDRSAYAMWMISDVVSYLEATDPERLEEMNKLKFYPLGVPPDQEYLDRVVSVSGTMESLLQRLARHDMPREKLIEGARKYVRLCRLALEATWRYLCHLRATVARDAKVRPWSG